MQDLSADLQEYWNEIPSGIQRCRNDEYWTMLKVNQEFLDMTGYTALEIEQRFQNRYYYMVHPDDREKLFSTLQERLQSGDACEIEYRLLCRDNTYKWIFERVRLGQEEGKEVLTCVMVDITAEKQVREELRLSLERHRIIMDQATDIIFEWDIEQDTLSYSANWYKKFGYQPFGENISYQIPQSLHIHPDDINAFVEIMEDARRGVPFSTTEFRIQDDQGRYIWCRIRATDQYDASGNPIKAVGVITDIDAEKRMIDTLKKRAERDALTGLYNRAETESLITKHLQSGAEGEVCALLMIDIDNFKQVNDTKGHLFGDAFLAELASVLRGRTRSTDVVGRIGGDEFMVYLRAIGTPQAAEKKAEQILETIRSLLADDKLPIVVSCSIGLSVGGPQSDYTVLYRQADIALYQAKSRGKNQMVRYEPSMDTVQDFSSYTSLGAAIDSDEASFSFADELVNYVFDVLYSTHDLDKAIGLILEIVGKRFDVSRAYIFENSDDGLTTSNTYEWCGEGIEPMQSRLQELSYDLLEGYEENFSSENVFFCRDITALPLQLKNLLEKQGVYSILQCAIRENDAFKGFVGFDECTGKRMWTKEEISILSFISKLLSTFLMKERARQRDQMNSRLMAEILDHQDAYIYAIAKSDYRLLYLNQKTRELDPSAQIGMCCYRAFFGRDEICQNCPVQTLIEQGDGSKAVYNPQYGIWTSAHASAMQWDNQDAYLLSCYDISKYMP